MKRLLLSFAASLLAAVPLFAQPASPAAPPAGRPNVLFIAIDDLRDWVGYANRNPQTVTPNIDRLAARGVAFTRAYCAAPVCNPSRAALMTGLRPSTSGVYDNNNDWRTVVPPEQTLVSTFRAAGYVALGSGKIYHESYARKSEWDDYLADSGKDPVPTGNKGVGGIKFAPLDCRDEDLRDHRIVDYALEQLSKPHDKPLFLTVGLHRPHMPWNVPQKYFDLHPLESIRLPPYREDDLNDVPPAGLKFAKADGDHRQILDSGRWKEAVQAYLAAVSFADVQIGRLIDGLDKSPYRDNTIIVLWGDHGWHFGEKRHWRKFALWEEATRAPLIWVAPGVTPKNVQVATPVDFMTIYPTLTDLCGIPKPPHVEGRSLRPLLADAAAKWDEPALTTFRFQNHAARSAGHRYIRYADGSEELYDETADPNEWTNLAGKPELSGVKSDLAKAFPTVNQPDIGGRDPATRKNRRNAATQPAEDAD